MADRYALVLGANGYPQQVQSGDGVRTALTILTDDGAGGGRLSLWDATNGQWLHLSGSDGELYVSHGIGVVGDVGVQGDGYFANNRVVLNATSSNGRLRLWDNANSVYRSISGANGYLTCDTGFVATTVAGGNVGQASLGGVSGTTGRGRLALTDTVAAVVHYLDAVTGGMSFSGTIAASNLSGTNTGDANVTTANEATDTTCFPLFVTASGTQTLQPKNNTALTFNSNTGALGATSFVGSVAVTNLTALNGFTDATPALADRIPIYDDSAGANRDCAVSEMRALIGVPSGTISAFGASSVPTGWLECDGTAVSRSTYADLFAVLSTTWGAGDGSTTFNVPDLRGRTIIGVGTGSGLTARSLAGTGGAETHALSTGEMPTHNHLMWNGNGYGNTTGGASGTLGIRGGGSPDGYITGDAGSGTAHANMQPWRAAKWIVKT